MTTQPKDLMTLEEAATVLKAYKKHLDDCESYDSSMLSRGEKVRLAAITSALHHLEEGRKENERLTRCLAYLTECNAATALGMPKSWARSQKDRFVSIVKSSLSFCLGGFPRDHGAEVRTLLQSAIERCSKVTSAPTAQEVKG